MNRKELVKEVAFQTTYNQGQVAAIISHMENRIAAALMRGEKVELTGFGTFDVKAMPARTIGCPSGGTQEIGARNRVRFRPGARLKRGVNR